MIKILANQNNCVGCRLCQMRCSLQYQNIFSISKAYIGIEWNEKACHFEVKFKDQCNMCGLCAAYCVYGALEIKRGGN